MMIIREIKDFITQPILENIREAMERLEEENREERDNEK